MKGAGANRAVWERLYRSGRGILDYPSEMLVRVASRFLDEGDRRVLDWGFGSGNNLLHLARKGFEVVGVEICSAARELAASRLRQAGLATGGLHLIDGRATPFPESSFDAVVAWQSLYYGTLEDLKAALAEIQRILKPGGKAVATLIRPRDSIFRDSRRIGPDTFRILPRSTVQPGAVLFAPASRSRIRRLFRNFRHLQVGMFEHQIADFRSSHWLILARS